MLLLLHELPDMKFIANHIKSSKVEFFIGMTLQMHRTLKQPKTEILRVSNETEEIKITHYIQ